MAEVNLLKEIVYSVTGELGWYPERITDVELKDDLFEVKFDTRTVTNFRFVVRMKCVDNLMARIYAQLAKDALKIDCAIGENTICAFFKEFMPAVKFIKRMQKFYDKVREVHSEAIRDMAWRASEMAKKVVVDEFTKKITE